MRVNLIPNPRFAVDLALWNHMYGGPPSYPMFQRVADLPLPHPIPVVETALLYSPDGYELGVYQNVVTDLLPVTPGATVTLSAWAISLDAEYEANLYLNLYGFDAEQRVCAATWLAPPTVSYAEWGRFSFSVDLSKWQWSEAVYLRAGIGGQRWATKKLCISAVMLSYEAEAGPYRDGSFTGWRWDGDAHLSSSRDDDGGGEWETAAASLIIDDRAELTHDNDVTLTIMARDKYGDPPDEMRLGEGAADADEPDSWTEWMPFATRKAWRLAAQSDEDVHRRGVGAEFRNTG